MNKYLDITIKKNVLISGGTRGIGLSTAEAFLKAGCNVGIFSRSENTLNSLQKKYNNIYKNKIHIFQFDATNFDSYNELTDYFNKKLNNKIDILVNNVGGGGRWGNEIYENTDQIVWSEVFNKNFNIAQKLTMEFLPSMIKNNWGRVITISSILGKEAGGRPWFNASKAAQISLMKTLSKYERATKRNITFNTIAPGAIDIPKTGWGNLKQTNKKAFDSFKKKIPTGNFGKPQDVANLVIYLASKYAQHINGSCITVDGGQSHSF